MGLNTSITVVVFRCFNFSLNPGVQHDFKCTSRVTEWTRWVCSVIPRPWDVTDGARGE